MKEKRARQIFNEALRRTQLLLENEPYETVFCTKMKFDLRLGLMGYPFKRKEWMRGQKFTKFVTQDEYESKVYDNVITHIFNHYVKPEK